MEANYLKIGKKAPAFSLKNQNGEKIALKDYLGKNNIVVYFYPKALTPGCTTQACGITDTKTQLKKLNTVVVGISNDQPEKLKKFEEKYKLNFNLLSDPEMTISNKYGVWGEKKFMGRVYDGLHRVTFIIDKSGKIVHVFEKVKTKTHSEDLISKLKELKLG